MSNEAEELCNQGLELMTQHKWAEAEKKMMMALDHDDKSPELHYNLGKCLFHQDKYSRARDSLAKAIELKPDYAEAHALLGSCYYALLDMYSAYSSFLYAIGHFQQARNPVARRECATARAHTVLAQGDYLAGFAFYTERLKEPDTWDGTESLVGKTLLVKAEGGLGDQIFFARYDRMLKTLGAGYVIWECDEPLEEYFRVHLNLDTCQRNGAECDYMVHAGSLPYILGTKAGTIPVFSGSPSYVENPKFIGIACSGNPLHPDDHHRSIPLAEFNPLWELDKDFYFVQKHIRESDKQDWMGTPLEDVEFESCYGLSDYMRVRNLDLVITVDTMTAHLAGAEGIPTWLLLPYAPDWRWGLEGERTGWYPSFRIFRQGPDRQWAPVIQRVVEELKK